MEKPNYDGSESLSLSWNSLIRSVISSLVGAGILMHIITHLYQQFNPPIPQTPHLTDQDLWTKEIVSEILSLYELLISRGYLKNAYLSYPPHIQKPISKALASQLGISDSVVELLENLPYVDVTKRVEMRGGEGFGRTGIEKPTNWGSWRYPNDFLFSSGFLDLRDEIALRGGRDPWGIYRAGSVRSEGMEMGVRMQGTGERLNKWQVKLTGMEPRSVFGGGIKHKAPLGGVLVLDILSRQLYTVGNVLHWETEPMIHNQNSELGYQTTRGITKRESIDPVTKGMFNEEFNGTRIEGEERIEMFASRDALEALKDYRDRFRSLEWIPGWPEGDLWNEWPREAYKELYLEHGWPDGFNLTSFEEARVDWHNCQKELMEAAKPIERLLFKEAGLKFNKLQIETAKEELLAMGGILESGTDGESQARISTGRTIEQLKEIIETGQRRLLGNEESLIELKSKADRVTEEARRQREIIWDRFGEEVRIRLE